MTEAGDILNDPHVAANFKRWYSLAVSHKACKHNPHTIRWDSRHRIVILDEASSRLDPVTELKIDKALVKLLANRTAIVIAHRLSTVERVDEIAIIEAGRVVEQGSRATLAAEPASYFHRLLQIDRVVTVP